MNHSNSSQDKEFQQQVESCQYPVSRFNHRAHLRLAYTYLVEGNVEQAARRMRDTLLGLLEHAGIDPSAKYHETLTRAWVAAVHHFMQRAGASACADDFIDANPRMLDANIMLTHYSAEVLFSERARRGFVEPDLEPIPEHGGDA